MSQQAVQLTFRIADPNSSEYDRLAELLSDVEGRPITGETLRYWDASQMEGDILRRYVACWNDHIIGSGLIEKSAVDQTGKFSLWLTIDRGYRGQGFGGQFYDFLFQQTQAHHATRWTSECKDNDPPSLAFAQKRGFEIRRHAFNSQLDLTAFDAQGLQAIIEHVKAQGIRFTSLAEEGNTEQAQRKLFDLNRATANDNPSTEGDYWKAFEQFKAKIFSAGWFRADGQILAVDGERYVGLGAIGFEADGQTAFNAFTGVDQAYRGRKIAQALKILGAQFAMGQGAQVIVTDNDSENASMLAVNDRLGYVRDPGTYWLNKQ